MLDRGVGRWLAARMAEVGRTALSAYMLQNILACAIYYSWRLDLAARRGRRDGPGSEARVTG